MLYIIINAFQFLLVLSRKIVPYEIDALSELVSVR